MKRVFPTGGNRFIGKRLRESARREFEIPAVDADELDIFEKEKVQDALKPFKPDFVIYAAAAALTGFCSEHPEKCRAVNVQGAVNAAEACRSVGKKWCF